MFRVFALAALCGCRVDASQAHGAFYAWDDRQVHCALDVDAEARRFLVHIEHAMDRAKQTGEVIELLVHAPGQSLGWKEFEDLLAAARDRDLRFYTYREMADPANAGPGVALQYDDWYADSWMASRDLLARYGAKVTIFVAHYEGLRGDIADMLRMLADDGNDIEPHTVRHLRGPLYVEKRGLDAYINEEVLPSIDVLRADGYPVDAFAYPFGERTSEMDRAIIERGHVKVVRSLARPADVGATSCPAD
jgi:peptidoglycan/xylan/chitin deacetylase (PgdA/CDA1 family)